MKILKHFPTNCFVAFVSEGFYMAPISVPGFPSNLDLRNHTHVRCPGVYERFRTQPWQHFFNFSDRDTVSRRTQLPVECLLSGDDDEIPCFVATFILTKFSKGTATKRIVPKIPIDYVF
mmetsp:Transcript_7129/g.14553  ORF Transcript_7129/g.14553 Transcript_7129/m.14553 type:complete len:119 (+) Transcript_7129:158-514(+)